MCTTKSILNKEVGMGLGIWVWKIVHCQEPFLCNQGLR